MAAVHVKPIVDVDNVPMSQQQQYPRSTNHQDVRTTRNHNLEMFLQKFINEENIREEIRRCVSQYRNRPPQEKAYWKQCIREMLAQSGHFKKMCKKSDFVIENGNYEIKKEIKIHLDKNAINWLELLKTVKKLDKAELISIEKLGQGGYGTVYKGKWKDGREVALKEMTAFRIYHPTSKSSQIICNYSTIAEMRTFKVSHPNVIKPNMLYWLPHRELIKTKVYMELELAPFTLSSLMRTCKLDQLTLKSYAHQLLQGLSYLHNQHCIHRDIKPGNLVIFSEPTCTRLAIIDFGMSVTFGSDSPNLKSKVATLAYRSPELMLGCTKYEFEVDIWAAGLVIFEMLTGKRTFPHTKDKEVLRKMHTHMGSLTHVPYQDCEWLHLINDLKEAPVVYSNGTKQWLQTEFPCDEFLCDLITRMLDVNPKTRISAKEALMHPFFANNSQTNSHPSEFTSTPPAAQTNSSTDTYSLHNCAFAPSPPHPSISVSAELDDQMADFPVEFNSPNINNVMKKRCRDDSEQHLPAEAGNIVNVNKRETVTNKKKRIMYNSTDKNNNNNNSYNSSNNSNNFSNNRSNSSNSSKSKNSSNNNYSNDSINSNNSVGRNAQKFTTKDHEIHFDDDTCPLASADLEWRKLENFFS